MMSFLKRIFSCCISAPAEDTTSEQRERSNSATQVHQPPQMQRRNSYASDFYQTENIIGYTGDLHSNPTVYYQRDEQGEKQYGHITTVHNKPDNVGKELVRTSSQYHMTHKGVSKSTGNKGTLQEWDYHRDPNKPVHKSRNKFVAVNSQEERQTLQQATQEHRNKKGRY